MKNAAVGGIEQEGAGSHDVAGEGKSGRDILSGDGKRLAGLDHLHLGEHGGDGVLGVERDVSLALPASFHDAQRVAHENLGEALGGGSRKNGDLRVGDVDQGEGADVVGVSVGE